MSCGVEKLNAGKYAQASDLTYQLHELEDLEAKPQSLDDPLALARHLDHRIYEFVSHRRTVHLER